MESENQPANDFQVVAFRESKGFLKSNVFFLPEITQPYSPFSQPAAQTVGCGPQVLPSRVNACNRKVVAECREFPGRV